MANTARFRTSPSGKSPGADVQEILTTIGLAASLTQKSSSTFMCRSSSAYGKDQVPCLLENSRPLSLRFPSSEDGETVCSSLAENRSLSCAPWLTQRAFFPSARVSLPSSLGTPQRMIRKVQRHTRFHVDRAETLGTIRRRVRCHLRKCSLRVRFCGKSMHLYLFNLSCAYTGCFSGFSSLDLMTCGVHSARHEQYSRFRCIAQAGHHTRHL